ncbi:MAG: hypothetical protein U9Q00_05525 [Synergistota bacterium]|nr:hypothetical protein [Synergistota bacterium]
MSIGSVGSTVEQQNPYSEQIKRARDEEAEGKTDGTAKAEPDKNITSAGTQDKYIPSDDDQKQASGVYRMEKDENGNPKVTVDTPATAEKQTEKQEESQESSKTGDSSQKSGNKPEKSDDENSSSSTVNTDSVDAEIKKLKQQRAQLQKQLQNTQGDENQRKNIEKQLAQVDAELSFKNTDAYRKQQSTYTA